MTPPAAVDTQTRVPLPTLAFAAVLSEGAGTPEPRAVPADAFRAARRRFLAGERLDMQSLAAELGVSRNTLYRWTGDRERLLADVMSLICLQTIEQGKENAAGSGPERIAQVLDYFVHSAANASFLRAFLDNEAPVALRLLTSREAGVQGRMVQAVADLIREEEKAGRFRSELDAETLAYALTRVIEAFAYNDTYTRLETHPERVGAVIRLMLRQDPPPGATPTQ